MINWSSIFCWIMVFFCLGCSSGKPPVKITVAAAASTQYVLKALIQLYEEEYSTEVAAVFSSSGKLTAQIEHGAPYDLFISADTLYPTYLTQQKKTEGKPIVYAKGKLMLWTCMELDIEKGLAILLEDAVKKIAIADPKTAPYGQLSQKLLEEAGIYEAIRSKVVLGESIGQVNQYVTTKAVSIGLTAKSVVMAPNLKNKGQSWEIPQYSLPQSMVLLAKETAIKPAAVHFYQFLQSPKAKQIFEDYGYVLN